MSSGTGSGSGAEAVEARLGAAVQAYQSAVDDFDRDAGYALYHWDDRVCDELQER